MTSRRLGGLVAVFAVACSGTTPAEGIVGPADPSGPPETSAEETTSGASETGGREPFDAGADDDAGLPVEVDASAPAEDAAPAKDAAPGSDAAPPRKGFAEACAADKECESGVCLRQAAQPGYCSRRCTALDGAKVCPPPPASLGCARSYCRRP